jgi:hypothetical protein
MPYIIFGFVMPVCLSALTVSSVMGLNIS